MLKFLFVFFVLIQSAFADLIVWQPEGQFQKWILYKDPNESQKQAIERYLSSIKSHAELNQFIQKLEFSPLDQIRQASNHESTLLIANSQADHSQDARRLRQVISRFQSEKMSTLTLPVGMTFSLNPQQKEQFFKEISSQFQLLVAMGGDDVHPEHYSEKITWARNLKTVRDALEIEIIQNYFNKGKGKILGFCRGLQITSVALGYKLNQDLIKDLHTELPHNDGAIHSIKLVPTAQGLISQIFSKLNLIEVNSYHHQSLRLDSLTPDGYLQVAALASDGVVEALEGKDGRVILFQFHPEMSDLYSKLGHRVFEFFRNSLNSKPAPSCRKAVANLKN